MDFLGVFNASKKNVRLSLLGESSHLVCGSITVVIISPLSRVVPLPNGHSWDLLLSKLHSSFPNERSWCPWRHLRMACYDYGHAWQIDQTFPSSAKPPWLLQSLLLGSEMAPAKPMFHVMIWNHLDETTIYGWGEKIQQLLTFAHPWENIPVVWGSSCLRC